MSRRWWPPRPLSEPVRDLILFIAGLGGIGWETFAEHADRPYLLALFAAMVGLPYFVGRDRDRDR